MTSIAMKSGNEVPVLFIIFNRPDHTSKVLEAIKKVKPKKLFIAADGPRDSNNSDSERCHKTRQLINLVDWECDVNTRFLDENLGCKLAVSSAISWFFEHVEYGIILEDDCVPTPSFFSFCAELLEKYKSDERVMQISGNNFINKRIDIDGSYYFSTLNDIWGWATWSRAWQHFDMSMLHYDDFKKNNLLHEFIKNKKIESWLSLYFEDTLKKDCSTWSSQWTYAMVRNNGLTITPSINLVSNIGFDQMGTHNSTKSWELYNDFSVDEMESIIHPKYMLPNRVADKYRFDVIKKTDPRMFLRNKYRRIFFQCFKKIKHLI